MIRRALKLRRAFTIVEILVCIAIIAILMGIALPALKTVRASSQQTACTSNLRQLMYAATMYGATNNEAMPPAVLYFQSGAAIRAVSWDFATAPDGQIIPGAVWQFTDTPLEVQQCPSYTGPSNTESDPYTGYNYNTTFIGHEGGFPTTGADGAPLDGWRTARLGRPMSAFAFPERTAVFGDGGWKNGANKYMRAPMNTVEGNLPLVCAGTQAFRHAGACTCCAYLDGHIGIVQQARRGALTTPQLAELVTDFPNNGFLSEDDSAYGGATAP